MKLKRLFISVTLALTMVLGLALPVFADTYLSYYPTTIVDSSGGAREALPIVTGINGQALIDAGLIKATGLDTRMSIGDASVAGNNIPYMISETQITAYLDSLPAYGQTEARLYTGYSSDVSGFDIITGTNGYITIDDTADVAPQLELGSDFEIEQKGYVDTTGGADTNLVYKEDAFRTYIDGATNITSEIHSIPAPLSPYSSASDGRIEATNVTYNTAWVAVTGTADTTIGTLGQRTGFFIDRAYFYFDTSALPDDCVIDSATLKLYGAEDESTTDFLITIQNGQPAHPEDPLVNGDYDKSFYSGDGGSLTTDGFSLVAYNDVPLNATGLTWISKTATTKFCVRSSEDIAGSAPANNEYVRVYTSEEAGVDKDPQLVVNYHVLVEVTATGIDSGEYTVKTYGVDNEPEWATGDVLYFDGTADIDLGNPAELNFGTGNFTVEAWVKIPPTAAAVQIVDKYIGIGWQLRIIVASSKASFFTRDATHTTNNSCESPSAIDDNAWHHVVGVRNGNDILVYVDAGTPGTNSPGDTHVSSVAVDCTIGATRTPDAWLTGYISDVRIYDAALNAETIADHYARDYSDRTNLVGEWYIDEGSGTDVPDYSGNDNDGTITNEDWETATYTTGSTGRLCDFYIEVDDGVTDADRWGGNLKGVSVPDNDNDWKLNQNNVMPKMEYYKHTTAVAPSGLKAWYEPDTIVDATDYDGTADGGSSDVKIIDAELIDADDYWNDALLTITSAGGAAPEGETAIITDFKDATNELNFAALTAAVEAGDTYTVDFATLTDRQGGDENAKLTWGVNSATTLTYGKVISYATTSSTASEEGGYTVPEADMPVEWYGTASNLVNLPLYDMYLGIGTQTGIPVQTLYVLSIVTVCFAFAIAGFVMFNSVMMSVIGVGVGLGIGSSMTVVPLWIFFTFLIFAIGIMYLKGRSGV